MRLKWIDAAKGIAILCVILGHVSGGVYGAVDLRFVYAFHLPIFFLLSGYTFKVKGDIASFLRQKFSRLMTPYFITCAAVLVLDVWNLLYVSRNGSIAAVTATVAKDLLRAFFASGSIKTFAGIDLGTRIGAVWFLPALFFALVIVRLVLQYIRKEWQQVAAVTIIAALGALLTRYIWLPFSIQAGMTASAYVLCGYYIHKYRVLERLRWYHYLILLGMFLAGIKGGYGYIYIVSNAYPDWVISFVISLTACLLLIRLAQWVQHWRVFDFLGRHSLEILCVHLVALETMGWYFRKLRTHLGLPQTGALYSWSGFVMNLVFSLAGMLLIVALRWLWKRYHRDGGAMHLTADGRDGTADILKGLLILLMLLGHAPIDEDLRGVIYSCHMAGFVLLSGYFHKPGKPFGDSVFRLCRTFLLPYGAFCLLHFLLHSGELTAATAWQHIKTYLLGMSFAKDILPGTPSVGPVYFLLLLFLVRLLYLCIDRFLRKNWMKAAAVAALTVLGLLLGRKGWWLPWSADAAMYCLGFYGIGVLCRRWNVLAFVATHPAVYFLLAPIWVYMIHAGSMELAVRAYEPFGVVILGALCGVFLLYMLAHYIMEHLPVFICLPLRWLGESTLYILIVHTLCGEYIESVVARFFDSAYVYHMVLVLGINAALGVAVYAVVRLLSHGLSHLRR